MLRLILLAIVQSSFLVAGQTFLKLTLDKVGKLSFSWSCIKELFTNLNFLFCGLCMAGATLLWFYILRHFPFSAAYPMISFSYAIGLVVSILVFHEQIPPVRYVGVFLIILGTVLVAQK